MSREDNPRLVSRQTYWIEFAAWASGQTSGPICTECAAVMPDAEFVGAFVCEECAPYVSDQNWCKRREAPGKIYKQTVTKTADLPIPNERPRDVEASGATT